MGLDNLKHATQYPSRRIRTCGISAPPAASSPVYIFCTIIILLVSYRKCYRNLELRDTRHKGRDASPHCSSSLDRVHDASIDVQHCRLPRTHGTAEQEHTLILTAHCILLLAQCTQAIYCICTTLPVLLHRN